jgi:hypothetical protein
MYGDLEQPDLNGIDLISQLVIEKWAKSSLEKQKYRNSAMRQDVDMYCIGQLLIGLLSCYTCKSISCLSVLYIFNQRIRMTPIRMEVCTICLLSLFTSCPTSTTWICLLSLPCQRGQKSPATQQQLHLCQ